MKLSSFSPLLAVGFMSFFISATTSLPNSLPPLETRAEQSTSTETSTLNITATAGGTISKDVVRAWCRYTHGMLFRWDLPTFIKHREANWRLGPLTWDWESDGCSHVSQRPAGVPFTPACQRHDFGYRNFQVQKHFTATARHKLDDNFLKDMNYQCDIYTHNWADNSLCKFMAYWYYWGVRGFYKGKVQHCKRSVELAETVESMDALETSDAAWNESMRHVYEGMDADEAKDASKPDLPKEKIQEYYQRAIARAEKAEEVARAQGGPNFYV